jgi:ribosomal-protein-alanine N-acetyltransferase
MNIRTATLEDLAAIAAIQAASPQASQWDPGSYLEHDCAVAVEQGRVTGFLVSRRVAPDERDILNVAVDPAQRRKGIARALLASELARGTGRWFLEVRASNTAALRLYETAGFQVCGRRPGYYQEPAEEGIVMRFFS